MPETLTGMHLFYLVIAIVLDVFANIFVKLSNGFSSKSHGIAAILCILAAFTALSFAVRGFQLSVAYAIWGGLGLIATAIVGIYMFNERLRPTGWLGIAFILAGVILMKLTHWQ